MKSSKKSSVKSKKRTLNAKILGTNSKLEFTAINKEKTIVKLKPNTGSKETFSFVLNNRNKSIYMKDAAGKLIKVGVKEKNQVNKKHRRSSIKPLNNSSVAIKLPKKQDEKSIKKFNQSIKKSSAQWGLFGQRMAYIGAAIATMATAAWGVGHGFDKAGNYADKVGDNLKKAEKVSGDVTTIVSWGSLAYIFGYGAKLVANGLGVPI